MGSNYERFDSVLEELKQTLEEYSSKFGDMNEVSHILVNARNHINDSEEEFRYLALFVDCIRKWSDADKVFPDLGSLAIKIDAVIEVFGNQLAEMVQKGETVSMTPPIFKLHLKRFRGWVVKLTGVLSGLDEQIQEFMQEISAVCGSVESGSVQCRSPMHDFDSWKNFVRSVHLKMDVVINRMSDGLRKVAEAFSDKLKLFLMCFPDGLAVPGVCTDNNEIYDFAIQVGNVFVTAAFLILQHWDRHLVADLIAPVLLNLQQKIDLITPQFVDLNLRLLKTYHINTDGTPDLKSVEKFVEYLLTFVERHIKDPSHSTLLKALRINLISLIASIFEIPEKSAEEMRRFRADVKILVMEVAYLEALLLRNEEIGTVVLNFFAEIWLIRLEIFLRVQLSTQDILYPKEQKRALNGGIWRMDLKEGQNFMKREIQNSLVRSIKSPKQILTFMDKLGSVVADLNHSGRPNKKKMEKVRGLLYELLLKIVLFKADLLLTKLHDNNRSLNVFVNDQTETLLEGLKFLAVFVGNQADGTKEDGEMVFARIDSLASAIISLCNSFPTNKITEEMINHTDYLLITLLDKLTLIMVDLRLRERYLHVPMSNFPKTNGLGFIDSLLRKLRELLNYKADLVAPVKHKVEEISAHLRFFRSFLRDILNRDSVIQELKDLVTRVVDAAYEAEFFIDSHVGGNQAEWHTLSWHLHFENVRLIRMQVAEVRVQNTYTARGRALNAVQASSQPISRAITPIIDEGMEGLKDQEDVIIGQLTGGFKPRGIVSIVGMPGIGKTTLARKVYNSPTIVYHFHVRAWGCVSQFFRKRELLLEILSHITALTENILGMTDEDLELKLYQLLKWKRYLIVMDDMWDTVAWDALEKSFPNDENGSRILITSRQRDVALNVKAHTDPHALRLLSDAESWALLQKKIFHEECCPEELVEVGMQIAEHCKGLPLAIVAIAGLLERTARERDPWKEIAENLHSQIIDDPMKKCLSILELSYKHLPDYLKACFLYCGVFREDEDIPAQKLIRLWIAENFIQETESKSLEDLAGDYLKDLIARSLVIFSQRSSTGGVKTCRVHDILRTLCQSKAQEENFLQLISRFDEHDDSFDVLDHGVDFSSSSPANSVKYEDHRICICSKRKHLARSRPSGNRVRSLLFSPSSDTYPRCPYDISFVSLNLKFIKVLDLESINMGSSFPSGIETLVHLRYFAASGDLDSVPSSIANLWNLETFLLKGLKGKVELPQTFWCMSKLRHVHVSSHAVFCWHGDEIGIFSQLSNLVTLSSPILPYGDNTRKILMHFPNIRKLRCIFLESWDKFWGCNRFPRLDILTKLESLKIFYYGRAFHPVEFSFPSNLKKLTLSNFRLPWNHVSIIGRLHNLKVLKLLSRAFEGERWDMEEGEFTELKFLKLDNLNIVKWNACSDHLPKLQQLVLHCCKHLEEVPSSFAEIPTLEKIEVLWCGDSAEEMVRSIRKDADEKLKIFVNLSDSNFRSSS